MGARAGRDAGDAVRRGATLTRLLLDTSILVTLERREDTLEALIEDEDDVAIAAITVAELLVGVELAKGKKRTQRRGHLDGLLDLVAVETYDFEVARHHA